MKNIVSHRWIIALLMIILLSCQTSETVYAQKRPKVGIAFGGGGAKGAAEVGVLKVIEELGIPVDYIAGTSIGSIVGGLYACGYDAAFLDSMFSSQEWLELFSDREMDYKENIIKKKDGQTYVFGFPVGKNKNAKRGKFNFGAIRGDNIVELLDSLTALDDSISFDELQIPFRCVATDIETQTEVVLSSGNLPLCMRASMAIPGAFKPIYMNGYTLLDGGMLNNLPVDVVREMGADIVIAIDLTVNKRETKNKKWKNAKGIFRIVDWAISRPDLKKYNENRAAADIYINPDLEGFSATSFTPEHIKEMIQKGVEAAEKAMPELQELQKKVLRAKLTRYRNVAMK